MKKSDNSSLHRISIANSSTYLEKIVLNIDDKLFEDTLAI
jgi:hypothetical protein